MKDFSQYEYFYPTDKSNLRKMLRSEIIQWMLNKTPIWNIPKRNFLLKQLFGSIDGQVYCVNPPFHCNSGKFIHVGKNFFANYNCIIMDHAEVLIGDNVMLAPNVSILTVTHPMSPEERVVKNIQNSFEPHKRGNIEIVKPIIIGNNVWIATGATVCAGVTIGDNSVIGAGSVVTKDIPANVFACGIPCKVVREITEEDKVLRK